MTKNNPIIPHFFKNIYWPDFSCFFLFVIAKWIQETRGVYLHYLDLIGRRIWRCLKC